ncbi:MAG TPA: hypothetical protein VFP00_06890 [Burkholderiales bacterium]|nr:hypothetical protein [Burkholderiales bacterium]
MGMQSQENRKTLARQLRDAAAIVREKLEHEGEAIAARMKRAADLLDGRAEHGIKPLRYPDA